MQLSPAQKDAVEYLGGPQIILAGAGSGKTRVIVAKAQYLIEEKGYAPESLSVITYSNKTQAELEDRMAFLGGNLPEIKTFHSLGMDLIAEFGHFLGISSDNVKTSEHKLYQHLMRAIGELPDSDLLDTNQTGKVYRDIQSFISRAKDELITPDDITARAEQELANVPAGDDDSLVIARERWTKVFEAGKIFRSYERIKTEEARLSRSGGIDYGDMIVLSHKLLAEHKIAAATVRSRVRHILVDEFQDANYAQVEILRLMAGKECGVTVVGDDDQAIYRFRGASFGSFRLFQKLFPGWRVFRLEENYRSQANIVHAAQALIETDPKARFDPEKKMTSIRDAGAKIIIRKCADDVTEAAIVASEIKVLLNDENFQKPASIAVLVRARRHKDILCSILEKQGIEYYYDRKGSELKTNPARILLSLFNLAVDSTRLDLLPWVFHHFIFGLIPRLEREINYRISRLSGDYMVALKTVAEELGSGTPAGMAELMSLLDRLRQLAIERPPLELLERIISEAGILKTAIVEGMIVDRDAVTEISSLLRSADAYQSENASPTHAAFLEYLDWQETASNENGEEAEIKSPIVIQTVHGSKGLEYPIVFMIGLSNRRFPPQKQYSLVEFPAELYKEELPPGDYRIQEERRLFYVGMTRAREMLYLSGVEKRGIKISQFVTELEKSGSFNGDIEKIAPIDSVSLERLGPADVIRDESSALILPINKSRDQAFVEGLYELWRQESSGAKSPEEFELLKAAFSEKIEKAFGDFKLKLASSAFKQPEPPWRYKVDRIAYTDLEAFKDCPLKFYYRKVLRIPTASGAQQSLGSVIHSVLEEAGQALLRNETPSLDNLITSFESRWKGVFMGDPDQKERLRARARDILERFMQLQSDRVGKSPVALEKPFAIALSPELAEESPHLTGRIDRIDAAPNGFEVIDYKTGKSTSRNAKDDLQLPIYSLACQQELGQPASRLIYMFLGDGVIQEASYSPEDLSAVRADILEIISEINNSDFVATPGHVCSNCDFARICPARQET